jgi:hypothetical protein
VFGSGDAGPVPHDFAFEAQTCDLDVKLRRRGADVHVDFLALGDAAPPGITFNEKRDRFGGLKGGAGEKQGKDAEHGDATPEGMGGFQTEATRNSRSSSRRRLLSWSCRVGSGFASRACVTLEPRVVCKSWPPMVSSRLSISSTL